MFDVRPGVERSRGGMSCCRAGVVEAVHLEQTASGIVKDVEGTSVEGGQWELDLADHISVVE
jgi:hypothetical protein